MEVGVDLVDGLDQLGLHPVGEGFERVRPVEEDRGDPVLHGQRDLLHRWPQSRSMIMALAMPPPSHIVCRP